MQRKIIHIDMDAFYASVEQRDFPQYQGKAIVVGGSPIGRGGVVATASYEARKYGVRSAMPSKKALELCPGLIFIKPRFEAYKLVSDRIREIFHRYTDIIEPLSLDEAYLDVTHDKQGIGSAIEIAKHIKLAIKDELNLSASAGVSINKFVAKVASAMNKPDGLTFIGPSKVEHFIEELPVEKFFGVGQVTAAKMKRLDIHRGADIKKLSESELVRNFGKIGHFFHKISRGVDDREVQPHRETKSLAAEDTFPNDLVTTGEMRIELNKIAQIVYNRLIKYGLKGRTITLKIRYSDFKQITRSRTYLNPIDDLATIQQKSFDLLDATNSENKKIRLLGITMSNFNMPFNTDPKPKSGQLDLF